MSRTSQFLLRGRRGPLCATYFHPAPSAEPRGDLLFCPPFAEEMNRCRAMVAMQARSLSVVGVGTLVVDPYGTGDSSGEFVEGTWEAWRDDLGHGLEWLRQQGRGCLGVWGIRLGAIMAAELALEDGGVPNLLLWQPVLTGKQFFTQFLRIRIAAEIEQADGVKTTDELRKRLADGESIEVSGYAIGPALAADLDRLAFPPAARLSCVSTNWLEVTASAESALPRTTTRFVEDAQAAGARISLQSVAGPPFWQVHEREVAPELIEATRACVAGWPILSKSTDPRYEVSEVTPGEAAERPIHFPCGEEQLTGVLHRTRPGTSQRRGVVIVVAGGPQYRAGAHRQFVSLARKLAANGYPVLRFDLRGMGDSSGAHAGYQESAPDIRAAIDALLSAEPGLDQAVLFGECESASGILFYAWRDPRVTGIALVNPWVRTEEGRAQVILKHYYWDRIRSPEFWKKLRSGAFDVRASLASLRDVVGAYLRGRKLMARAGDSGGTEDISELPLPQKTAAGLRRFRGQVMLLMSGRDYIAREFDEVTSAAQAWAGLLDDPNVLRRDLMGADHTFSRAEWKSTASDWVVEWLDGLSSSRHP